MDATITFSKEDLKTLCEKRCTELLPPPDGSKHWVADLKRIYSEVEVQLVDRGVPYDLPGVPRAAAPANSPVKPRFAVDNEKDVEF